MSRATTKVIISLASGSGNKEEISGKISEIFDANGIAVDISLAQNGDEVADLARTAAHDHWNTIVAGGGDGTINAIASRIVDTDKVLGVLPLGTLNHFARDLKLPNDLEAAVRAIAAGHVTNVDVGEVNGRVFVNNSSLGLYPTIVREREKKQRLGSRKWPAFIWAAFTALRRYPFLDVRLIADGKKFHRRTPFVFIGNNEYVMETFNIGMRECLDRGNLSVYITHRTGRWGLVRLALRALLGQLKNEKDFMALRTREVTIETRHKRLRVAFDGEVDVMEGPLHYRIRPGALRVIVPENEEE
jgi:YegS/Rv2252/BmrU family lipid kinase